MNCDQNMKTLVCQSGEFAGFYLGSNRKIDTVF